ncbi:MAG: hypothetical protein F4Z01_01750 [Gammaproteobacteria bacterium]|nr:hypothetical protein [Gammaproteobacteria bacterium]MYF38434.1 hypothetical protein [Gammaproteobacteria bacterium]
MSFSSERGVFNLLKEECSDKGKLEYEQALRVLVDQYNTTIYENRFIVGGVVEVLTYALLKSVGIGCDLYSNVAKSGDIILENEKKISVKSQFTGRLSAIKLMNKQGGGKRVWNTATLFVIANVGMVFGTPKMVDSEYVQDTNDGLELKVKGIRQLISNERNIFEIEVPQKQPTAMTGFSHKASAAVARRILMANNARKLLGAMKHDLD